MNDDVKRAGLFIATLIVCILGVFYIRVRFFSTPANADVILPGEVYPDFGMVIDLIEENDLVVVQTRDGNQWVFSGIEDWFCGDYALLVFNDNGTRYERSDDWIVDVRYITFEDDFVPSYFRNMVADL